MNNAPLLSICIPTFNRADCLKQCLESIVGQFRDPNVLAQTEVVISDNASKDSTQNSVKEFQAKYPNIHYYRNLENLGFDRNVLNVVKNATGEYCWLLGDDDALFSDALPNILPSLQSDLYDYLMANVWGYDTKLVQKAVSRPNLLLEKDLAYEKLSDYVQTIPNYKDIVGNFGGMSGQIFRRSIWQRFNEKERWIGSQAIHLFILLGAYKNQPFNQIAKPIVKTRAANMRWETFPGLESLYKRAVATHKTTLWILNLYNIPYWPVRLKAYFYLALAKNWAINFIKKYLLGNARVRAFVVPKLKKLMGV